MDYWFEENYFSVSFHINQVTWSKTYKCVFGKKKYCHFAKFEFSALQKHIRLPVDFFQCSIKEFRQEIEMESGCVWVCMSVLFVCLCIFFLFILFIYFLLCLRLN